MRPHPAIVALGFRAALSRAAQLAKLGAFREAGSGKRKGKKMLSTAEVALTLARADKADLLCLVHDTGDKFIRREGH